MEMTHVMSNEIVLYSMLLVCDSCNPYSSVLSLKDVYKFIDDR